MAYIGTTPTKVVSRQSVVDYRYTATAGQTAFTGADLNNQVLACNPADMDVRLNGVTLDLTDWTATATTLTLAVAATAGDEVTVAVRQTFEVADTYAKTTADDRFVNVAGDTMTGDLVVTKVASALETNNAPVTVSATNDTSLQYVRLMKLHDSSMKTPQHVILQIGKEDDGLNTAQFGFGHYGDASTSNYATIGLHSKDEIIKATGSGAVQMQYQPVFLAGMSGSTFSTGALSTQIIYNTTMFDRGNNYSTSTGRFTAPVAGVYHFTHRTSHRGSNTVYELKLFQNGVEKARQFVDGNSGSNGGIVSCELNLQAGDYVDARGYWGTSGQTLSANQDITSDVTQGVVSAFSGYLIG